jgi:hypothetical protein
MLGEISLWRLYVLRAGYLLLVVGLGLTAWPSLLDPAAAWPLYQGVVQAVLGAIGLLAVIGLFHPLRMLPLLLFELTWKTIWLVRIGWPLWRGGHANAGEQSMLFAISLGLIYLVVIPWDYVARCYLAAMPERFLPQPKPRNGLGNLRPGL